MESKGHKASMQIKGLADDTDGMGQKVVSLEVQLERKSEEISEYMSQITNLKEEIINKVKDHNNIQEKKKWFM